MDEDDGDEADKDWKAHVHDFRSLVEARALGKIPDDLVDVLAELSIASPAIVALRALLRGHTALSADEKIDAMDGAAAIGWAFRNLMNLPDSIAILRSGAQTEPYWKRVLEYCAEGCLQAVMDEYVHALIESH